MSHCDFRLITIERVTYVSSDACLLVTAAASLSWFHLFRPSRRYNWKLSAFALVPGNKYKYFYH